MRLEEAWDSVQQQLHPIAAAFLRSQPAGRLSNRRAVQVYLDGSGGSHDCRPAWAFAAFYVDELPQQELIG